MAAALRRASRLGRMSLTNALIKSGFLAADGNTIECSRRMDLGQSASSRGNVRVERRRSLTKPSGARGKAHLSWATFRVQGSKSGASQTSWEGTLDIEDGGREEGRKGNGRRLLTDGRGEVGRVSLLSLPSQRIRSHVTQSYIPPKWYQYFDNFNYNHISTIIMLLTDMDKSPLSPLATTDGFALCRTTASAHSLSTLSCSQPTAPPRSCNRQDTRLPCRPSPKWPRNSCVICLRRPTLLSASTTPFAGSGPRARRRSPRRPTPSVHRFLSLP